MVGVNVKSEIKTLKKVLVHRPGKELLNLTPDTMHELLFDDIPFLRIAQEEHDLFAKTLAECGAEVVYLEDLVAEVLDSDAQLRKQFLDKYILEAGVRTDYYKQAIYEYLDGSCKTSKDLVLKTMEGVYLNEIPIDRNSLIDMVSDESKMVIDPMPNLYFTRDPFAMIGNGVSLNRMYAATRRRETLYGEYIFKYHPDFKDVPKYYDRTNPFHIEGGDILNISDNIVAVGISQRTEADAIEMLAKNIFTSSANGASGIDKILAISIPNERAFMHLDTVFTQIDYDKFTVHPKILETLRTFEITPNGKGGNSIKEIPGDLETVLSKYLGLKVELIRCAKGERIASEREQWNDGTNTLCVSPGKVVVYDRNEVTNNDLRERGVNVIEVRSSEIARGRGGPRCMSMPIHREE